MNKITRRVSWLIPRILLALPVVAFIASIVAISWPYSLILIAILIAVIAISAIDDWRTKTEGWWHDE